MDMDMKFFRKLPVPKELKEQFPADERIVKIKQERDPEIRQVIINYRTLFCRQRGCCP